jgi:hypothetical protein
MVLLRCVVVCFGIANNKKLFIEVDVLKYKWVDKVGVLSTSLAQLYHEKLGGWGASLLMAPIMWVSLEVWMSICQT